FYTCFFTYSARHRYVHSFPTRRSSDLRPAVFVHANPAKHRDLHGRDDLAHVLLTVGAGAMDLYDAKDRIAVALVESVFRRARYRDRKSTRLNSSHVKISYAVFCLKKKI